ncbi:MAG TPA: Nif3-like dinuclear metal center hexameric protein [Synergistaceae bacterium]|nr:Nif3-like dinuclear metal center hexameric protein [Synergistaceae bacterium]HPJ24637.1 Nif3-like dinuclear metal center hexameric protein [Synergistaceae bacterium]HPQ36168.1 Nif3-like dinuclear metal center hexameric protein [Synergistaceae bacterium]
MHTVGEFLGYIEKEAPFSLEENWDNVGLLVGDAQQKISGVAVALNALPSTVASAVSRKCSLLITHHPPFFTINRVCMATPEGEAIKMALCNDLAIISLHTNLDRSSQGINVFLGKLLGLRDSFPLVPGGTDFSSGDGLCGFLPAPADIRSLGKKLRQYWELSWAMGYLAPEKPTECVFSRIAILGGSGSSFWKNALDEEAELFITGDMKYHDRLEALQKGLSLIEVDHGEMEQAALFAIARNWEAFFGKEVSFSYIPFQSWEKPAMLLSE